jgi:TRAP-type C4-dicarboxylate transport system permease small subunit
LAAAHCSLEIANSAQIFWQSEQSIGVPMLRFIETASDTINSSVEKIVAAGIVFVGVLISVGIITRDVLGFPIIWLSETTMLAFSWTFFLGISVAFKRNENICVEIFIRRLNVRFPRMPRLTIVFLILLFLGVAVKEGIEIVESTAGTDYNTINVSTAWFYASFPVSAVISIVHLLEQAMRIAFGPTPIGLDATPPK